MVLLFPGLAGSENRDDGEKIISRLRDKYAPMYKRYLGVKSVRMVLMKEFDNKSGELLNTSRVKVLRKDYFYRKPEVTLLSYIKDGKEADKSEFKGETAEPWHPPFDEQGSEHYDLGVKGVETIRGVSCYRIRVIPKKRTPRHFTGEIYLRTDNLNQVKAVGSSARLSFPLKEFTGTFYTEVRDGVVMMTGGSVRMTIDVPVVYPNRRFESTVTVLQSEPIPR